MYGNTECCCDPRLVQCSLSLIIEALEDEAHDRMFYQCLLQMAPDRKQCKIIESIRNDEMKHFKMFRIIYEEITCKQPPCKQPGQEFEEPESYCDAIETALFGELNAVEMYRRIMFGLCSQRHRDMLFEIITDEMKHSVKWNFLYNINRCTCCD
ncbi:ferritin-like domain-containing protein [Pelosinus propionicus]|uniref:Rubrerythrin n=1 Tax=Pelosinus propionicus DSM 13327 TaxID=1123291 RepID=A0A1I4PYI7_9FIRM|nr:ferritin-like domain-containing protein [Pelosinus propionicus]SFM32510.1 Rubrerythrin [Pelosinus propionicus DSM 13327]